MGFVDWMFRDRTTGRIVIGQWPDLTLWVFIVATALRLVFDPGGAFGTALDLIARVAIVIWAIDEIWRGVNPWRRLLGATVLAWQVVSLVA